MTTVRMFNYVPECVDLLGASIRILQSRSNKDDIIYYPQKSVTYTIRYKQGENKIVFIVSYGKSKPSRCYNRSQAIYDDSILSDEVIHMTNQFIFIIYENKVLCSDHNKRNVIINYLHSLDKNFSCYLLSVSTSIEDFIEQATSIDSVSITATNDLFIDEFLNPSWGDDIDEKERPETTVIRMDFKRALNERYLRNLYNKLKQPSYITAFNIRGESSDGFISINEESVVAKDIYEFEKEEGYYDIDEVFEKV